MKHTLFINKITLCFLLLSTFLAGRSNEIRVENPSIVRNGDLMTVSLTLDLDNLKLKRNQAVVLIPELINQQDTFRLDGVGIYGRTRWYQMERKKIRPLSGVGEQSLRYSKEMKDVVLNTNIAYEDWMNGSTLILQRYDYGCSGCGLLDETYDNLAYYKKVEYQPVFIFEEAIAEEVKSREISGRAYVEFPVNQIEIYPDYRNNRAEIGKILASIDSIKNDKDISVTNLHIVGTASPEGPYENNVYLAKNRTLALKEYVRALYNFPENFITTDFVPVDWSGLQEWLENNRIEHREEILAIVTSDLEPFARNSKIKKEFPAQYQWLLTNVYPSLRHSDYRIDYSIREFNNIEEIAEVIKTVPQKLSLNEMYYLASNLPPGSDEYNEVFETAVRLFPDDEVANLNAAISALQRNDLISAEKYLQKAGKGPKTTYAYGVMAALKGDYAKALELTEQAFEMGLNANPEILENIKEMAKYSN